MTEAGLEASCGVGEWPIYGVLPGFLPIKGRAEPPRKELVE
jgi:hypothetical protein